MFNPFTLPAVQVFLYAAEEAERLSHDYIGTEHLLLGLLRDERSVAAEVLTARGLHIEAVREAIVELHSGSEQLEPPAPPPAPANTYQWPQIPFVPSRTVHILYSGMRWPHEPVINFTGTVFSAYGFTLEDIIVRAWDGSRWHVGFSVFTGRSKDAPMFPLDAFAVHSVPFMLLVKWFEEIFGGQVIDETGLPGIYGFELKERVDTPDALIRLLRDEAGLVITRQRREIPTLIVRHADWGQTPIAGV